MPPAKRKISECCVQEVTWRPCVRWQQENTDWKWRKPLSLRLLLMSWILLLSPEDPSNYHRQQWHLLQEERERGYQQTDSLTNSAGWFLTCPQDAFDVPYITARCGVGFESRNESGPILSSNLTATFGEERSHRECMRMWYTLLGLAFLGHGRPYEELFWKVRVGGKQTWTTHTWMDVIFFSWARDNIGSHVELDQRTI